MQPSGPLYNFFQRFSFRRKWRYIRLEDSSRSKGIIGSSRSGFQVPSEKEGYCCHPIDQNRNCFTHSSLVYGSWFQARARVQNHSCLTNAQRHRVLHRRDQNLSARCSWKRWQRKSMVEEKWKAAMMKKKRVYIYIYMYIMYSFILYLYLYIYIYISYLYMYIYEYVYVCMYTMYSLILHLYMYISYLYTYIYTPIIRCTYKYTIYIYPVYIPKNCSSIETTGTAVPKLLHCSHLFMAAEILRMYSWDSCGQWWHQGDIVLLGSN
jgi:hypothetical protein